jgi:surfactin synthase thioesterase subunit
VNSPIPHTLIVFHHAGGSPAAFISWRRHLAGHLRLVPATLPGRAHLDSYPAQGATSFVSRLGEQLGPWMSTPYTIYGHSMGATVGLAVALSRVAEGKPGPRALIVGAATAPASPYGDRLIGAAAGANPLTARSIAKVKQVKLDQLHADLSMLTKLRQYCLDTLHAAADFPIHVFVGRDDPLRHLGLAQHWYPYTSGRCTSETIDGDHFFHRDPGFVKRINRLCAEFTTVA